MIGVTAGVVRDVAVVAGLRVRRRRIRTDGRHVGPAGVRIRGGRLVPRLEDLAKVLEESVVEAMLQCLRSEAVETG